MAPVQPHISVGEWKTRAAQETLTLGKEIDARLNGGEILLLNGPLGAGKTVFVKGLACR